MNKRTICWPSIRTSVSLVLIALVLFTVSVPGLAQGKIYSFGTGSTAASWYPITASIRTLLTDFDIQLQTTGGITNVVLVSEGRQDFAYVQDFSLQDAKNGTAPFEKPADNLRLLYSFMKGYSQYVVPASSDMYYVEDLAGKKVNMVTRQFSTCQANEIVLKAAGIYDDVHKVYLDYGDGAEEFVDGQLDALLYPVIAPNASIENAGRSVPIRLLQFRDELIAKIREEYPPFIEATLEGGIYSGIDEPIQTLVSRHVAFTNAEMDEDVVYHLVKTVFENKERLEQTHVALKQMTLEEMAAPIEGLEFHPGALRYFREKGLR
ncbi:MAG: TAXI family TRAP transporter solute-binding subunit [Firmicutes bacterium]|nr:TAXI family TRAP transporter solute-binding subunit [Bacillota bacterium]